MTVLEPERSFELDDREERLRLAERALSPDQLLSYRRQVSRRLKDPDTYAVLVYCLGLGIHHLYLRKFGHFVADFMAGLVFWISLLLYLLTGQGLPWSITILAFLYCIGDFLYCLFLAQRIVRVWNLKLCENLLKGFDRSYSEVASAEPP